MKAQVELALKPLMGTKLIGIFRALNLERFVFDTVNNDAVKHGAIDYEVTYALHVQCMWRITGLTGIVVGSEDRFYRRGPEPYYKLDEFDWRIPRGNRADEKLEEFLNSHIEPSLVVTDIAADEIGGLSVCLNNMFTLEIIPSHSMPTEFWRFLDRDHDSPHFVVTGLGIE